MSASQAISHIALVSSTGAKQKLYGWQAALCLASEHHPESVTITHVCSDQSDPDADQVVTLQSDLLSVLKQCGLSEQELINNCDGCYHFADRYQGFSSEKQDFYMANGELGVSLNGIDFQHYLTRFGWHNITSLSEFSLTASCAQHQKFALPVKDPRSVLSTITYGINVSVLKLTALIRAAALKKGVIQNTNSVETVTLVNSRTEGYQVFQTGFISKLVLTNNEVVDADFFFDCSGTLRSLVCDQIDFGWRSAGSALATNAQLFGLGEVRLAPSLASRYQALPEGYFRLLNSNNKQFVQVQFNSDYCSSENVLTSVASHLDLTHFNWSETSGVKTGISHAPWSKNCVLLGSAACELNHDAGVQLRTIVHDVSRFLSLYPDSSCDPISCDYYNLRALGDYQEILDWQMFCAQQVSMTKSRYWCHHQASAMSERLKRVTQLFLQTGCYPTLEQHVYTKQQWITYMLGFEFTPLHFDPLLNGLDDQQVIQFLSTLSSKIKATVNALPKFQMSGSKVEMS